MQPTSCPWLAAAKRLGGHTHAHLQHPGGSTTWGMLDQRRGHHCKPKSGIPSSQECHSGTVTQPNSLSWAVAAATNTPLWQALKA